MYRNITLEIIDKIQDFKKVKWKTKGFQTFKAIRQKNTSLMTTKFGALYLLIVIFVFVRTPS